MDHAAVNIVALQKVVDDNRMWLPRFPSEEKELVLVEDRQHPNDFIMPEDRDLAAEALKVDGHREPELGGNDHDNSQGKIGNDHDNTGRSS